MTLKSFERDIPDGKPVITQCSVSLFLLPPLLSEAYKGREDEKGLKTKEKEKVFDGIWKMKNVRKGKGGETFGELSRQMMRKFTRWYEECSMTFLLLCIPLGVLSKEDSSQLLLPMIKGICVLMWMLLFHWGYSFYLQISPLFGNQGFMQMLFQGQSEVC